MSGGRSPFPGTEAATLPRAVTLAGARSDPRRGEVATLPRAVTLAGARSDPRRGEVATLPRTVTLAGGWSDPRRGKVATLPRAVTLAGARNDPRRGKVISAEGHPARTRAGNASHRDKINWTAGGEPPAEATRHESKQDHPAAQQRPGSGRQPPTQAPHQRKKTSAQHHNYHHCCSSLASIDRTKSRVHPAQTQRVRFPSLVSTMSAHQVSGGSPSSSGSATRPQIEHVSRTIPFYPRTDGNRTAVATGSWQLVHPPSARSWPSLRGETRLPPQAISRNGAVAPSWQSTPIEPSVTRWISR